MLIGSVLYPEVIIPSLLAPLTGWLLCKIFDPDFNAIRKLVRILISVWIGFLLILFFHIQFRSEVANNIFLGILLSFTFFIGLKLKSAPYFSLVFTGYALQYIVLIAAVWVLCTTTVGSFVSSSPFIDLHTKKEKETFTIYQYRSEASFVYPGDLYIVIRKKHWLIFEQEITSFKLGVKDQYSNSYTIVHNSPTIPEGTELSTYDFDYNPSTKELIILEIDTNYKYIPIEKLGK